FSFGNCRQASLPVSLSPPSPAQERPSVWLLREIAPVSSPGSSQPCFCPPWPSLWVWLPARANSSRLCISLGGMLALSTIYQCLISPDRPTVQQRCVVPQPTSS